MINATSNALDGRLAAMAGLPDVAWQGGEFSPKVGELYLRANNLRGASSITSLGYSEQHLGIYQVDVVAPKGRGRAECELMADTVRAHFRATPLFDGVEIQDINTSPMRFEGAWSVISVSVSYRVLPQ